MKQSLHYISMHTGKTVASCLIILMAASGCKKYLEVQLPIGSIAGSTVFDNDYTSAGALNNIYNLMYVRGNFDGSGSVGFLTGLYGDEFRNHSTLLSNQAVYANTVSSTLGGVTGIWTNLYNQLYSVNLAIEGLTPKTNLNYRDQWLGEAYFLRGLIYFYLTNLHGEVPLVLGSDYLHNNGLARSPQAEVYKQIVADLQQAQSLLAIQYKDGNGLVATAATGRARPNRAAATALLARVYLYLQDWQNASAQADNVIADAATFKLVNPAQTFLVNSNEIVWGLVPTAGGSYPFKVKDAVNYIIPKGKTPLAAGVAVSLSDSLVKAFEAGDLRYTNWVGIDSVPASGSTPAAVYYFAYKYKANGTYTTAPESVVVLRLAEQYLIRAEARAQQSDVSGALADLNAVRARAGLMASTAATQAAVLSAIQKERRIELFAEIGNRFFDLRRTGALDALMTNLAPLKGGTWAPFKAWWPIPQTDIDSDKQLEQTPGFQ
jgi:hypothetical protein